MPWYVTGLFPVILISLHFERKTLMTPMPPTAPECAHLPPARRLARVNFPVARAPRVPTDAQMCAIATLLEAWLDAPDWAHAGMWLGAHVPEFNDGFAIASLTLWIHLNEATHSVAGFAASAYLRWHRRVLWRLSRQHASVAWRIERAGW
jgi:hypothetical protein